MVGFSATWLPCYTFPEEAGVTHVTHVLSHVRCLQSCAKTKLTLELAVPACGTLQASSTKSPRSERRTNPRARLVQAWSKSNFVPW